MVSPYSVYHQLNGGAVVSSWSLPLSVPISVSTLPVSDTIAMTTTITTTASSPLVQTPVPLPLSSMPFSSFPVAVMKHLRQANNFMKIQVYLGPVPEASKSRNKAVTSTGHLGRVFFLHHGTARLALAWAGPEAHRDLTQAALNLTAQPKLDLSS